MFGIRSPRFHGACPHRFPRHDLWIDQLNIYHGAVSFEGTDLPDDFGREVVETVVIKHLVDKATPKIQELCMNGGSIDWGYVEFTQTVAGEQVLYRLELEGIKVVSAVIGSIAPITILMCVSVISEICYNIELRKCFDRFDR